MTPIEREPQCPGPSRFWEVAFGGTWDPGERLHVETCPQCRTAEQAIRSSVGRRGPGEPDPDRSSPVAAAPTVNDTIGLPQATAGASPADRLKGVSAAFQKDRLESEVIAEAFSPALRLNPRARDPLLDLTAAEEKRNLHAALSRLPDDQREVLERYYLREEGTRSEIADAMGISLATFNNRLNDARKKLKRAILAGDPEAISNAEAGVEEQPRLEAETTGTRAPFDSLAGANATLEETGLSVLETDPSRSWTGPPSRLGDYELLEQVGSGGMGVVYKVRDLALNRILALKIIRHFGPANDQAMDRFFREARLTSRLRHPSIVPIYHVSQVDGMPYVVRPFIEGEDLSAYLKKAGGLTARDAAGIVAKVADGLDFAHRHGVVHRDVKPSNILIDSDSRPVLTDFGLARSFADEGEASLTYEGTLIGTPAYMSPEQADGRLAALGPASDIYSLGATLHALLTGRPPFQGSPLQIVHQLREDEPVPPRRLVATIPPDLEAICLKALSKRPADRYSTAREMAEDLRRFLDDRPILGRRPGAPERLARWARRRPAWFAVILTASLAVVLLLAVLARWFEENLANRRRVADAVNKALTAAMGGDLDGAEQAISEAEYAGASTGQARMLRGQIALHRGQSQEAMRHLEQAVRLLPKSVATRGMLAAAYASDGDWERYDQMIREMEDLTPSTPEDFLFKGYAEASLEPERGLRTIAQAFERHPMMGIARLLRADVRALVAQDRDALEEAEGAVQDAEYAKELLPNNPAALWVSVNAHLAKAGVHEHSGERDQRRAELELAGQDADALKRFTELPEAVVYRWLYFREMHREEEVLEELRLASEETDHVYVTFCYALTLYRRGGPGDLETALRVLEKRPGTYNDRLLPFVLAEHDYQNKDDWSARAQKAAKDFAERVQDDVAAMDTHAVLCLLGNKEEAVRRSKELQKQPERFDTLRREPLLACLRYNAGDLPAIQFIAGAKGSRWNQCLVHYYVAMTKLAEGDRIAAQEHFEKAIKTRALQWGPYDMSWVFQARLAKDPAWPRWISKSG
jgi:RNA polymerase sigma factor (sigma-70 family)